MREQMRSSIVKRENGSTKPRLGRRQVPVETWLGLPQIVCDDQAALRSTCRERRAACQATRRRPGPCLSSFCCLRPAPFLLLPPSVDFLGFLRQLSVVRAAFEGSPETPGPSSEQPNVSEHGASRA